MADMQVIEITGGKFAQVTEDLAVFMADEETIPPTTCPELVPAGWRTTGEILDYRVSDGWVEVYLLERDDE